MRVAFTSTLFVLDTFVESLQSSTSRGSDSSRGSFPAGFFALFRTEITQSTQRGKRERTHIMKSSVQRKTAIPLILITLTLACVGLLPSNGFGVVPPPDGGYPGGNTAEGQNALLSRTTGGFNAAIGWLSLRGLTTGSFNTGVGAGTLALNTGDENTATGAGALLLNTTGFQNTANGVLALLNNSTGGGNTASGFQALLHNTTGDSNTANGVNALGSNTTGDTNTANGVLALGSNTVGMSNTAVGALALLNNTTGTNNTAVGVGAGSANITGTDNIYLGSDVPGVAGETFAIRIGHFTGGGGDSACYIAGIYAQPINFANAIPVQIDTDGKLGGVISSRRFKHDIKPMDKSSEAILALKPVIFHYKSDAKNTPCFGLIAEEVAAVDRDLVVRDKKGEISSVRYDAVNAMLLNEFLKEHRKVEQQDSKIQKQGDTIAKLKNEIVALVATVKDQAAQIQKVSAQIELSTAARQTVLNSR